MYETGLLSDFRIYMFFAELLLISAVFLASKKHPLAKKFFIVLSIVINIVYLVWRTVFTLPFNLGAVSICVGILLLFAEWMGFWQFLVFRLLFWTPYQDRQWPNESFDVEPTVDVFISTYNESIKILKKTISGCQNLDYPKDRLNIYLCDDGRRSEIRLLCEELGVHYLTREDNKNAKAGNINNALKYTQGEFIMLLDADMVPKSFFLKKTIGYFVNKKMGFVQTPQMFYNPDPFQFNLKLYKKIPNEQDFFMRDIQGGRDNYNAVLHVGTNAVFRRKAIEDIGGIPTGTITEDMATGMLIQAKGYESRFVKEVLCTGLSVESFSDLVKQRERWCRGNIQVTKKWNPLTLKGLSPMQRVIYVDGLIYWFFGVQKMIYLICPLVYLIFGKVILNASLIDLLIFWFPSYLASIFAYKTLVPKSRSVNWSHVYEAATAPFLSLAALVEAIFSRPIPFRVTPKGIKSERTVISLHYALPHIVLLVSTLIGWTLALLRLDTSSALSINATVINLSWSVYNAYAITASILVCIERPRKRNFERLATQENITLSIDGGASCRIVDISESGAKVECDNMDTPPEELASRVQIKSPEFEELDGTIVWSHNEGKQKSFGIKFKDMPNDIYRRVVRYISDKSAGYHDDV